ncbi:MAG: hypothetical protein IPP91_11640 [Betaproteobacteria bacterium]|nr:hypothetical protein [Betaproteobacteria bacterium]
MAARHLLYLTNENLVSLVAHGGRITGRTVFPVSGAGMEDFERHLHGLQQVPTHLITDLAEEDFRLDTIPHLGGRDQEAVLTRKLSQLFRGTPYRHAIAQGREADGRRDDRVIYTAITNGEILRPWVEVLERLKVPVEGIHSSAVFSGRLLSDLGLEFPHTLLVTFTPGDALRQTYFRNKEIKFSRLTPVDLEEGQTLGNFLAEEIGRTWQYLDTLRYFAPTDGLEVCVLLHPKDRPSIEPVLRDFDQIQYRLLDIEQVAAKLGLKPPPVSSSAEEVLSHLFLRRPGANNFASPELRRYAMLRNARIAIYSIAGAFLGAGVAYGGWNLSLALQNRGQDLLTARQIMASNRELDDIARSMPAQGVGGQTMRDTVAFYSGLLREYPTVESFLLPVSVVLEKHPKIRLTQVAWQSADDDKVTPLLVPIIPREAPPLKAMAKGADPTQGTGQRPAAMTAEAPFSSGRHAVAILEATVTIDGLGFRAALSNVQAFVADIAAIPGYQASLFDSPLDITPRSAISARLGERDPVTSQARFSVRVSRATEPRS